MDYLIKGTIGKGHDRPETKVQMMLRKADQGDQAAIKYLEVGDTDVKDNRAVVLTWPKLCCNYQQAIHTLMAAHHLNLELLHFTCKSWLKSLKFIATTLFKKDFDDDTIVAKADGIRRIMTMLTNDLPREKFHNKYHQVSTDEEDQNSEEEDRNKKASVVPKRKTTQSDDGPSRKKRPRDNNDEDEESGGGSEKEEDEEEREDEDHDSGKGNGPEKKPTKRSHHKKVKCRIPGCNKSVVELKRHLKTHVKKGEIDEEDIERTVAIMKAGKKQRGKKMVIKKQKLRRAGRFKKWCPVSGCNVVTSYMQQHLLRTHMLKKSEVEYRVMLKSAKRYTGLAELDVIVNQEPTEAGSASEHEESIPLRPTPSTSKEPEKRIMPTATEYKKPEKRVTRERFPPLGTSKDLDVDDHDVSEEDNEDVDEHSVGSSDYDDPSYKADVSESSTEEEEENDPAGQVKAEHYYTKTKYENNRHHWLCGYYQYLELPDAGYKKKANRLQHVGQVKSLLNSLDPEGEDITSLGDDGGDAVWLKWVKPHLENETKAPGTMISYLTSLEKFFVFVVSDKYIVKQMPPLHPNDKEIFRSVIPALKGWRSTVDNETQSAQNRRYIRECDDLLTPDEIRQIKESRPFSEGMKCLMEAKMGKKMSQQNFADARDLLLVKLTLATGTRPGALEHALIEDYETAQEEDGNKIILVPKHKRSKDGPAMLGMDREMQGLMKVYMEIIRPQFAAKDEKRIFVKTDGHGFVKNTIGKRLQAFWVKSGVTPDKKISTTGVRKSYTTATNQRAPEQADVVQKVMSHSNKTSRNCYVRSNLTKTASDAMKVIKEVTSTEETGKEKKQEAVASVISKSNDDSNDDNVIPPTLQKQQQPLAPTTAAAICEQSNEPSNDEESTAKTTVASGPVTATACKTAETIAASAATSEDETAAILQPLTTQEKEKPTMAKRTTEGRTAASRQPLTEKEKEAIHKVFHNEIKKCVKMEIGKIRNKMCTNKTLRNLVSYARRVKQVSNHLNYIIDSRPTINTQDDPVEKQKPDKWLEGISDDENTSTLQSSSFQSGHRQYWDNEDTASIEKRFASFNSCPSKYEIRSIFNATHELSAILAKEGFSRCYEKVKGLMKKKKKR